MGLTQEEINLIEMRRVCIAQDVARDREAVGNLVTGFICGVAAMYVVWAAWTLFAQ